MFVIGLTGSIGMGKSWGARCFRLLGVPVHDADGCVHRLMSPGGAAVKPVSKIFPGVLDQRGGVDRLKLGEKVLGDDTALDTLEAILHPLVRREQRRFLGRCRRWSESLAVLDIPLLYETGSDVRVDAVVVVSAPERLQRHRVLRRTGMTTDKFDAILARQLDDRIKRQIADFVVSTGGTRGQSLRRIANIVKVTKGLEGRVWGPNWSR